ncbi:MAG: response regulator transcription factor [Firmicutes bacterium]|jgi:two-component system alkaline phosphatase synthesis response regulator PhoP|nr:response regulator transcription factor [Bacillota bacterium]NLO66878.1 response regulator transcription factor [Bacillota bacterium]
MSTVFYVEDDQAIRDSVLYALTATGFTAEGFEDGESFYARLEEALPDLVLLDIMLPGEDGLQILRRLRSKERTRKIPVIMLTAKGAEFEKVIGLDSGADDYIAKPFGVMELISRINAVLRRTAHDVEEDLDQITVGGLTIDRLKRSVLAEGKSVEFTLKEFEVLYLFMSNVDRVFTRDELLDQVWGYDFQGETRTVDVHIGTIRQKLGDLGKMIKTVRGVGYKLSSEGE